MKMDTLIKVLAAVSIVSAVFAFIQGYFAIQIWYFLIIIGIISFSFVLWHKKETKTMDVNEAYKRALPILKDFKVATESGAKLKWASKHSDNKRFSSYGKIWDLEFSASPNKVVVQMDAKTGKIVNLALDTEGREPPFFAEEREPLYMAPRRKYKREVKEEVKPE